MKQYFCVGSYTETIFFGTGEIFNGKGRGISICSFEDGHISVLSEIPVKNPSFLWMDEKRKRIYAVNELEEYQNEFGGGVTEISYDKNGDMNLLHSFGTGGSNPCHILVSPHRDFLLAANYSSGSLSAFPLDCNGHILPKRQIFHHTGRSVHPLRQSSPHAHSIIFYDQSRFFVVDLGLDLLAAYKIENSLICADPENTIKLPPGTGPRFGEFSPDRQNFYLVNELSNSVSHFRVINDGFLERRRELPSLPPEASSANSCADLHISPDGRFLYLSNRGHNSISCFSIAEDGSLVWKNAYDCHGKTPRNFAVDPTGNYLLAANQDSDSITVFLIKEDGNLLFLNKADFSTPVCIRFFNGPL